MKNEYDLEKILELHDEGLTDREIAEELGYNINSFSKKRSRMGLSPNKPRETIELTQEEREIICGTLLGDSTVRYVHDKCKYPNLTFSHCVQQKEYFMLKTMKLGRLCSSFGEYKHKKGALSKNETFMQFTGKNMKCLVDVRNLFYKSGIKIIPVEYLKENFSELSVYYLMMDDGSYDITTNSYIINTQCFSKEDLILFTNFLHSKFKLNFSIKTDNSLYLKHESNDIMIKILQKYNECDSMNYKCCL